MIDNVKRPLGLLGIDVDGTLITDDGHITRKVYNALDKAVSAGWEFVIASGRTYYAAQSIIGRLPFLNYAILSNGSCILDVKNNQVLHLETLAPEVVRKVVRVTREQGAIPVLYNTDIFHQAVYYDTLDGACEFFKWYVSEDKRCERVGDIMEYTDNIQQVGMIAARDIIFSIRDLLEGNGAQILALPFESPHFGGKNRDYWFLQVVNTQAVKIDALRKISRWLDIPAGRLIAVGDNYNDADMIKNADVGIAMGNAPDEIKELAHEVVGSNNVSGLVEVIDRIVLNEAYFE